jgi:hypothetical protein
VAESGERGSGHQRAVDLHIPPYVPNCRGHRNGNFQQARFRVRRQKQQVPRTCRSKGHGQIVQLPKDLASRTLMCWQRSGGLDRPEVRRSGLGRVSIRQKMRAIARMGCCSPGHALSVVRQSSTGHSTSVDGRSVRKCGCESEIANKRQCCPKPGLALIGCWQNSPFPNITLFPIVCMRVEHILPRFLRMEAII